MSRRRILVSGADGKLGRSLAKSLHETADVIGLVRPGNRRPDFCHHVIECDLAALGTIGPALEAFLAADNRHIDGVINNAADVRFLSDATELTDLAEDAMRQYAINVLAPGMISSELFLRQWRDRPIERDPVSILNISSVSGMQVFARSGQATYAASKSALNMFTLHMAADYEPYNIRVNALAPGAMQGDEDFARVTQAARSLLDAKCNGRIVRV